VAQGDRVLVVGFATGRIKATNKTFEDDWIFAITVRDGKLTSIREYVDTQALARAYGSSGPEDAGNPPEDRSDLRASWAVRTPCELVE
jgi:hypothetical protein